MPRTCRDTQVLVTDGSLGLVNGAGGFVDMLGCSKWTVTVVGSGLFREKVDGNERAHSAIERLSWRV